MGDKHEEMAERIVGTFLEGQPRDFMEGYVRRYLVAVASEATMAERARCQAVALTVQMITPHFGEERIAAGAGRDAYIFGKGVNDTMHAIATAIEKEPDSHG